MSLALVLAALVGCTASDADTEAPPIDSDADTDVAVLRGLVSFGFPLPERTQVSSPTPGSTTTRSCRMTTRSGARSAKTMMDGAFPTVTTNTTATITR